MYWCIAMHFLQFHIPVSFWSTSSFRIVEVNWKRKRKRTPTLLVFSLLSFRSFFCQFGLKATMSLTRSACSNVIVLCIILCLVSFKTSNSLEIDEQFCTIEIEDGRVRGKQNRTLFENKIFFSFRGLPFAKPPINDLRFKVKWVGQNAIYKSWVVKSEN